MLRMFYFQSFKTLIFIHFLIHINYTLKTHVLAYALNVKIIMTW